MSAYALPFSQLGIPKPLAYGEVNVAGNEVLRHEMANKDRISVRIFGEGPWDGLTRAFINRKLVSVTDTNIIHFHPGYDGDPADNMLPVSLGGDQHVDQFFSSLPAAIARVTYSGMPYVMMRVMPDPQAPTAELEAQFHARAMLVRSFAANGSQLAFAFSKNYAWQMLDIYLRSYLKRDALKGEALTATEKSKVDFVALADTAANCDALLASGKKRFEGGFWFTQETKVGEAIERIRVAAQAYVLEVAGVLVIRPDKPRTSVAVITKDHVVAGSERFPKTQLRQAPNRWTGRFWDPEPHKIVNVVSVARAANVVTVTTEGDHPFLAGDDVELQGVADNGFNVQAKVTQVPTTTTFTFANNGANANSAGGWVGMPEQRFIERPIGPVDHDVMQRYIAQRGVGLSPAFVRNVQDLNLGSCSADQVQRTVQFLKTRTLGPDQEPYAAPREATLKVFYDASVPNAQDGTDLLLGAILPGELVTIDKTVDEEFAGNYEVMEQVTSPIANGEAAQAEVEWKMLQVVPSAYSDAAPAEQVVSTAKPGTGLNAVEAVTTKGDQYVDTGLGSLPAAYSGAISYSSSSTAITWSWPIQVRRTDKAQTVVDLNGSQACTGLNSATAYNHYPFLDDGNGGVFDMVRTGGVGVPSWAHVGTNQAWTQEQSRADHLPLSNAPVQASTSLSGTSSGTGGGDPVCPRRRTLVEERTRGVIPVEQLRVGDYILGPAGWRRVVKIVVRDNDTWVHVNFGVDEQDVTPGHRFRTVEGACAKSGEMGLETMIGMRDGGVAFPQQIAVKHELDQAYSISLEDDEELGELAYIYYAGMKAPVIENHNARGILAC